MAIIIDPNTGQRVQVSDTMLKSQVGGSMLRNKLKDQFFGDQVVVSQTGDVGRGGTGGELDRLFGLFSGGNQKNYDSVVNQNNRMSRAQLAELIAKNPSANYQVKDVSGRDLGSIMGRKQDAGFIDQMAAGFIKPFADIGTGTAEQLRYLTNDQRDYKPAYMSEEEWKQYQDNPLLKNIQNVAGVASYAIPGGGSFLGALGKGALAGGMYGFSQADATKGIDKLLEQTAMGTIGGGVGGGLTYGAGKGLQKLLSKGDDALTASGAQIADDVANGGNKLSNKLRELETGRNLNAFRRDVGGVAPSRIGNTNMGTELEQQVFKTATENGIKLRSVEDLAGFSQKLFDDNGGIIQQVADDMSKGGVRIPKIKEELLSTMQKISENTVQSQQKGVNTAIKDVLEIVDRFGDDPAGAYKAKQIIGSMGKWAKEGQITPATKEAYEAAYGVITNKLDDTFKANGFTDFRKINENLELAIKSRIWADHNGAKIRPGATLNDPAQDVAIAAGLLTGGNPAAAAGGAVLGKFLQSTNFERGLGKVAGKTADLVDLISGGGKNILPKIKDTLDNVNMDTSMMTKPFLNAMGSKGGAVFSQMSQQNQGGQPGGMTPVPSFQGGNGGGGTMNIPNPYEAPQQDPRKQALFVAQLMDAGLGGGEINMLMDAMGMGASSAAADPGKNVPAAQLMQLNDLQSAVSQLDAFGQEVDRNAGYFGPIQGGAVGDAAQSIARVFNAADPTRSALQTQADTIAQVIGRAMEGGKLTDSDFLRYKKMLPSMSDNPAEAAAKIEKVKNELINVLQGQQQGLMMGGYNPYMGSNPAQMNIPNPYLAMV